MRCRRALILAALPLAALGIAGCGGGGGEESTESTAASTAATTPALSKAELIEQGDAICAEVNAAAGTETNGEESSSPAPTTLAGLYSGMVNSLNNLGTPQESAGYSEFSGAAEELAKAEGEVKLASEGEDTATLETAESNASSALSSFQEAAREYGFKECAEGPSAPAPSAAAGTGEAEAGEAEAGAEAEAVEPEAVEPEAEAEPAPEVAPEAGGAGAVEGGGTGGGGEVGGGTTGGGSGGIGPG